MFEILHVSFAEFNFDILLDLIDCFRFQQKKWAKLFANFLLATILAPLTLANVASRIDAKSTTKNNLKFWVLLLCFSSLFALTITFYLLQILFPWAWSIGFVGHLAFSGCITIVRMQTREEFNIPGHIIEDFLASVLLYPSVVLQIKMSLDKQLIQSKYSP